jgi:TonB-linked SusC/RagA family outer membrane protein
MWEAYRNQLYYVTSNKPTLEEASRRASGLVTGVSGIKTMLGYNIFGIPDNEIVGVDGKINPNAKIIPGIEEDLDWYSPIKRTGKRTDVTISNSGGNEKTSYHSSLGYTDEEGYVLNSGFKRFTGRINITSAPKKWLNTGFTLSGTMSETDEASTGSSTGYVNPFFFARNMGPLYPVYTHDLKTGDYILDNYGEKIYDLGNMSQYGLPSRPAGASVGRHVVAETLLNVRNVERNALDGKTFIEIPFLKDFKFTTNLSINLANYRNNRFDNKIVGDGSPAGRASKESNLTTTLNFNQLLTYTKAFGNHNIDALVAHESYDYKYQYFYGFRQGIIADGNIELINFTTTNSLESSVDRYRSEGYFTRVNYDYDSKYLLSASYRRDGSSRFAKDVRWGNFWSVGSGWRIDREAFMQGIKGVDMLKLRASYGEVGVDAGIGYYAWQALYSLGNNNALEPGILQSTLLSDKLTWEKNANFDIALEFGVFERFRGTIEFFNRQSSNLLFDVPKPLSSGILSRDENVGSMFNRGLEVELGIDVVKSKDFNWKIDLNATSFKNQITKMPDGQPEIISGTKKLKVGQSLYDYWLREWNGVDPVDGVALYRADPTIYKSDLESVKTNPTSTVMTNYRISGTDTLTFNSNKAKYIYSGSAIPKIYGSITNTFNYKQIELSFMLTYQYGGKVYDATYASLMDNGNYGNAIHTDMLKRWQKEGDKTDVPRMDGNSTNRSYFGAGSTRWLTDASYINIRSVNLSYNLPKNWMKKIDLSAARFFVSGENLMLFAARKGMAPQQSFTGVTSNDYIPSRILTLGVNVTF